MDTLRKVVGIAAMVVVGSAVGARAEAPEFTPKVTDVTVFKDGHTMVMERGKAVLEDGWARTRMVPSPLLGAFWAYAADDKAKVDLINSAMVDSEEKRPVLTFDEIIQANIGTNVEIVEQQADAEPVGHQGKLLGILQHEADEETETERRIPAGYDRWGNYTPERTVRGTTAETASNMASFVMLQNDEGVVLVKRDRIQGITFATKEPKTTHTNTKKVRELSLHLSEDGKAAAGEREIGFVYVQKGIRWIPDYRIELLDEGKAKISLQGTIVNELAELENVNVRLVVGVPSFIMKDDISPMALREVGLNLGRYFQPPSDRRGDQQSFYLSNAIMSQAAMPVRQGGGPAGGGGPDIPDEGQQEDLYLYHKEGLTLKKGGRAIVQLFEVVVPYEDVYTWDIPPVPPRELWNHVNQDQQRQLIQALTGSKAMHELRLKNTGKQPWTVGPATIFKDGAILGQQLMTFTSVGNEVDVPVTVATDLNTKKVEKETGRITQATKIAGYDYAKVSLNGQLTLTNFKDRPVKVYVKRKVIGTATEATEGGEVRLTYLGEDASLGDSYPWRWWSWPYWWYSANAMSEVTWEVEIPAGGAKTLSYDWFYYFRH